MPIITNFTKHEHAVILPRNVSQHLLRHLAEVAMAAGMVGQDDPVSGHQGVYDAQGGGGVEGHVATIRVLTDHPIDGSETACGTPGHNQLNVGALNCRN